MKLIFFFLTTFSASILLGQSKSQLKQEVETLKTENQKLKSQIEELNKPYPLNLDNKHQKASYGLGILIGSNVKTQGGDSLDVEALTLALKDVILDRALKMEMQEAGMFVQTYMQQAAESKGQKSKTAGEAFLSANKNKEGIQTTASGLQYKILTKGTGKTPTAEDNVTVHYTGKLIDGTVFDSSVERGEPISLDVNGVIPGWTEALQLMKEGGKWMLYIPYNLAYGERGAGGQIPPYSALIFEVELLKVN